MKEVIYARVSTEEQDARTQLADIYASYPESRGAEVVIEKQSAWKDHLKVRPKFKKISDAVRDGTLSALYVWDLDRLYRNQKKTIAFLQLCELKKCRVYSHRQKWLNSFEDFPEPWGSLVKDMIIKVLAWVAEDESNRKSERVKMKVVREGGVTTSTYGRKWGRKSIDLDEAEVLRLHASGMSYRKLGKRFGVSRGKIESVIKKVTGTKLKKHLESPERRQE